MVNRELLLRAAANEADLPPTFALAVAAECPWLNGTEEVSESQGIELLTAQKEALNVGPLLVEQFFYSYNAKVRAGIQQ